MEGNEQPSRSTDENQSLTPPTWKEWRPPKLTTAYPFISIRDETNRISSALALDTAWTFFLV